MKNNQRNLKFFENRRRPHVPEVVRSEIVTVFCPECGVKCIRKPGSLFLIELREIPNGCYSTIIKHEEHVCKCVKK